LAARRDEAAQPFAKFRGGDEELLRWVNASRAGKAIKRSNPCLRVEVVTCQPNMLCQIVRCFEI
jgi:hypothetical protein